MAKRLLPPDWHVTKDNGDPASDATLSIRIAGTSTATPAYSDKELLTSLGSSVSCDSTGYPASGGNDVALWGADDISYDIVVTATGYNGSLPKTLEDVAVAEATTTDETSSELALGNALDNGGFDSWSGATTFSNVSGDGDGDEVADGWYVTQPTAAANAISRQAGFAIGSDPVEQRYSMRVGRPQSSSVTNEIRLWNVLKPEVAWRLRGKAVTLRYSLVAGANFSATGLSVTLATGTTESEDGDLIDSGGFAGHANAISQARSITTTATRYEDTVTLGSTIKEIGIQFSYTPVGTAGADDWFQVQDVELKESTASAEFAARPEPLEFILTKLSTMGRNFLAFSSTDPNADRIVFWDDSAGVLTFLTASTGLTITTTNISIDQSFAPTWTGTHTHEVAVDTDLENFSNTTTTHDLAFRFASSGTLFELTPKPSGSADATKGFGYDYTNSRWFCDTQLLVPAGSAATPGLRVGGEANGVYSSGANAINLVAGGTNLGGGGTTFWTWNVRVFGTNGSAAAPASSPSSDTNTGWVYTGSDEIDASCGGSVVAKFKTTGMTDASDNLWLVGGKRAWPINAAAMSSPGTNGAANGLYEPGNGMAIATKDFDQSTEEYACITIPMPKSWNEGTFTARFRWESAGTGNVIWGIAAACASDDDTLNVALGTAVEVTDAQGSAGDVMVSAETSAITAAGSPAEGDLLCIRVYRKAADGSDTLNADARLIAVDLFPVIAGANDV